MPSSHTNVSDHPRIRGEHERHGHLAVVGCGSSPHTRGAPALAAQVGVDLRIIPAYAGSTGFSPSTSDAVADHPRIRGEHGSSSATTNWSTGSSPHTRGARPGAASLLLGCGIIPAYAGSTCRRPPAWRRGRDHPRIRGEHEGTEIRVVEGLGSSPHTRGAPDRRQAGQSRDGIIPAYAGSTLECRTEAIDNSGSSPHTRGARALNFSVLRESRIIPAYAGSTRGSLTIGGGWRDHPRIRGEHLLT